MVRELLQKLSSRLASLVVFIVLLALGVASPTFVSAEAPAKPDAQGTQDAKQFDPTAFSYTRPTAAVWRTPTFQQLNDLVRAPTTRPSFDHALPPPFAANDLPSPRKWLGADVRWFAFRDDFDDVVPALLLTPTGKAGPFPLVVATHGLFSHKSQVVGQIGFDLIERGFAVLAVDLPFHGERTGFPGDILESRKQGELVRHWTQAVTDLRQALDLASATPEVDASKPILAVGYSLGSWMSTVLGASDERIKAMALMVGGATDLPRSLLATAGARSCDPRVAVAAFSPRPVLFVSARYDRVVTAIMTERLVSAAREPKTQRWYDMGHLMSEPAYSETAQWLREQYDKLTK